jgi:hypothetical protein
MKYREKTLVIGMVSAGLLTAGLALPSSASALSLGGDGVNGDQHSSSTISLGTMAGGSLQGGSWGTLGGPISGSSSGSGDARAQGSGDLKISNTTGGDRSATEASATADINAGSQVSGNTATTNPSAANLQGGLGIDISLSARSTTENKGGSLLGL